MISDNKKHDFDTVLILAFTNKAVQNFMSMAEDKEGLTEEQAKHISPSNLRRSTTATDSQLRSVKWYLR